MMNSAIPSMDAWMREAKADPSASKVGMYLVHNGVVRETPKAVVREGAELNENVTGMNFSYNADLVEHYIAETYKLPGVYYIRTWLASGTLNVGDDIMYIMIGGDIRPHVLDALQFLVGNIKSKCVVEQEVRA